MVNSIKISIIIPVYNAEQHLKQCLESVVNQTLEHLQIICINDGSKDKSLKILKEYASKDARFTILNQKNQGAGISRNAGLDIAKGEFIAFMDADDCYPDEKVLEDLYNTAISQNVLICGGRMIDNKGQLIETRPEKPCDVFKNQIVKYTDFQYEWGYQAYIYSNEFIKKYNLRFPPHRRYQDPPWFVKIMYLSKEFYAMDRLSYVYCYTYSQSKWALKKYLDHLKGVHDVLNFSRENSLWTLHTIRYEKLINSSELNKLKPYINNKYVKNKVEKILNSIDTEQITAINPELELITNHKQLKDYIFKKNKKQKQSLIKIWRGFLQNATKKKGRNMDFEKYFKSVKTQRQIDKLAKKLKGKKVVIYGAGQYCRTLFDNYDLSKLNLVAVADRAFEDETKRDFYGLNCIVPGDLKEFDCDIILLGMYDVMFILDYLEEELLIDCKNSKIKIRALIRPSFISLLKEILCR